jgi:predicted nucleotidyltransferase
MNSSTSATRTDEDERLAMVCRRYRVRRLSLFGSRLKGTARPDSDIDLLIEFWEGEEPGLIGMATIAANLSEIYGGQTVDLRTPNDLSRHFRDEVLNGAEVRYAG